MIFLIFLLFLIFPLGQFGRWDFGNGIVLHLNDLVVALAVGGWGVGKIKDIKITPRSGVWLRQIKNDEMAKPVLVMVAVMGVSLAVNSQLLQGKEILSSGMYLIRWVVYAGLYFTMRDLPPSLKLWRAEGGYTKWLILAGTAVAVLGILQYFFYPDLRSLTAQEWDPHYYRIVSTFLDPGFTGAILAMALVLITGEWGTWRKWGIWGKVIWGVNYAAFVLTYSRASYLMFLIAIWVWGWQKKIWRVPAFLSALLLATMLILPRPGGEGVKLEREASIWARINNWENSLKIIRDHPIFGVGFNAYRFAQRDYGFVSQTDWQKTHSGAGADSSLLFIWATTGTVGLLAYLWLLKRMAVRASPVTGAILVGLLVHSFFSNTLFYPWIMEIMWLTTIRDVKF